MLLHVPLDLFFFFVGVLSKALWFAAEVVLQCEIISLCGLPAQPLLPGLAALLLGAVLRVGGSGCFGSCWLRSS